MTITMQLPPDVETKLREVAARHDAEAVRNLLSAAVAATLDATVEALLQDPYHGMLPPNELGDDEFEALADELANMTPPLHTLSDWAVSREGIYQDH